MGNQLLKVKVLPDCAIRLNQDHNVVFDPEIEYEALEIMNAADQHGIPATYCKVMVDDCYMRWLDVHDVIIVNWPEIRRAMEHAAAARRMERDSVVAMMPPGFRG